MKKVGVIFLIVLSIISVWYLFIKTNDFEIIINAKTSPGTVYQSVLDWNEGLNKSDIPTEITQKIPFNKIIHTYYFESYKLEMDWEMNMVNDSVTRVAIGINDLENSLDTRIKKLMGTSPLEELLDREFSGFNTVLTNHLKQFSVKIDGPEDTSEAYAAYINISCHQNPKAVNMMKNSTYINGFLQNNGIKLASHPFLEIVDWNIHTGQLNFNFCFPIAFRKELPFHKEIRYKKVKPKKSIKATFHGNYSYTDEAWFALYQYIQDNQMKPSYSITEIFYENPHTTVEKDVNWKAAIYMEIE